VEPYHDNPPDPHLTTTASPVLLGNNKSSREPVARPVPFCILTPSAQFQVPIPRAFRSLATAQFTGPIVSAACRIANLPPRSLRAGQPQPPATVRQTPTPNTALSQERRRSFLPSHPQERGRQRHPLRFPSVDPRGSLHHCPGQATSTQDRSVLGYITWACSPCPDPPAHQHCPAQNHICSTSPLRWLPSWAPRMRR
jgi:hypothetical protein